MLQPVTKSGGNTCKKCTVTKMRAGYTRGTVSSQAPARRLFFGKTTNDTTLMGCRSRTCAMTPDNTREMRTPARF